MLPKKTVGASRPATGNCRATAGRPLSPRQYSGNPGHSSDFSNGAFFGHAALGSYHHSPRPAFRPTPGAISPAAPSSPAPAFAERADQGRLAGASAAPAPTASDSSR